MSPTPPARHPQLLKEWIMNDLIGGPSNASGLRHLKTSYGLAGRWHVQDDICQFPPKMIAGGRAPSHRVLREKGAELETIQATLGMDFISIIRCTLFVFWQPRLDDDPVH